MALNNESGRTAKEVVVTNSTFPCRDRKYRESLRQDSRLPVRDPRPVHYRCTNQLGSSLSALNLEYERMDFTFIFV
jgi:hypothetical protein